MEAINYEELLEELKKEGKITGYPHLDNIHKYYYGENGKKDINVDKTMYRFLKDRVDGYNGTAISFYGKTITYDELLSNILKYAKSFYEIGVRPDTRVTFLLPSTPETYYMFYALDMLGAKRNMVDLRTSVEGIKKYINETNSEYLLCMESYSPNRVKELLDNTCLKQVVVTNAPIMSISSSIKRNIGKLVIYAEKFGYKRMGNGIFLQQDFENLGRNVDENGIEHPLNPLETSLYMHTSGTMKFPKTVKSNDRNQKVLSII